jgi:hypothetical protein
MYFKVVSAHNYNLKFYQIRSIHKFRPKRFHKIDSRSSPALKAFLAAKMEAAQKEN